jgi:hypothetical protein
MADDPAFGTPFVDIDEWREAPLRHRYVHGGFEGTHTLFSFYLPPPEQYQGRFFQYLEGGAGGHESLLAASADGAGYAEVMGTSWVFDLAFDELGGYLVESNQGHYPGEGVGFADDVQLYRASAQAARYSRRIAAEMYDAEPHHGYVWGQSGGGVRSGMCLENVSDVWAGGVPEVGTALATMPLWSSQALATELLRKDKLHSVVDALEPGGSGDPYAGLDSEQAAALANLFRIGFSPTAVSQLGRFTAWVFNVVMIGEKNPGYYEDFWTKPGYLGYENPESLRAMLVDDKVTVTRVVGPKDVAEAGISLLQLALSAGASGTVPSAFGAEIDYPDPDRLFMTTLRITSGRAAGREMYVNNVLGGILTPFAEECPEMFDGVAPGDEVTIDNRDYLAYLYYHRYNVAGAIPQLTGPRGVIDEFRHLAVGGRPIYAQQYCAAMANEGMPVEKRGDFKAKAIVVMCKQDICVPHGCGTAYDRVVRSELGDRADDTYRMWWVDNASHVAPSVVSPTISETENDPAVWNSRLVDYDPLTAQALRDVVAWAEQGIAPPPSTRYRLDFDNELVLAPTAAERGGIQPVVTASVRGGPRVEVSVGEAVELEGRAEVPPGTGTIVRAQWDPEGVGAFGQSAKDADGSSESIAVSESYTYTRPGTYFPSFRVGSHRHGTEGKGDPVWNLARVRVVVTR